MKRFAAIHGYCRLIRKLFFASLFLSSGLLLPFLTAVVNAQETWKLPQCSQREKRHITEIDTVFVRLSKAFPRVKTAEDFVRIFQKEKGISLNDSFCPYGFDVLHANEFNSILEAQFEYSPEDTSSFQYVDLTLCLNKKDDAVRIANELSARYQGFDELSQCHYVGWDMPFAHREAVLRKKEIAESQFDGSVEIFAGDIWIILGKAINDQELKHIKEKTRKLGLKITVFRDALSGGD